MLPLWFMAARTTRLEKRIRALEGKTIADPVVLYFADGSTQEIRGSIDFLMSLLSGLGDKASLSFTQVAQLDLIGRSVTANEPRGARLIELIRALLPAGERHEFLDHEEDLVRGGHGY
jgi:hypothetical protein